MRDIHDLASLPVQVFDSVTGYNMLKFTTERVLTVESAEPPRVSALSGSGFLKVMDWKFRQ